MNQTINKIVESIESLSSAEKYLLFEQLAKRKLFNGYEKLYPDGGESLEIAQSDFNDYLSNLEDYEDRLAKGEIKW
ncbi:hypothetical protein PN471_08675 [Aphanizomenon sp. CS-733/32]|uniref:hypothetical protein n=1 Tax=Aphanizomenon sp. CS-733/32 TaxID=3021715 RepID=UPI00232D1FF7|nr:hypothetical protein [Aphanizomenon sp. CS-733/32]MDB9308712.1 hypothetical protein [Aphanizomenon sp. CS-733/32]